MTSSTENQMLKRFEQCLEETAIQKRAIEATAKQELLSNFQSFLQDDSQAYQVDTEKEPDLYTLLAQQTALKNEVKLESRQFKTALDKFDEVFDALRQNNEQLKTELAQQRQQHLNQLAKFECDFLLDLLDLRDRLQAGWIQTKDYHPGWLARSKGNQLFIENMCQGLEMNVERLDEILHRHNVTPIKAIGMPFQPDMMQAIAVEHDSNQPDAIVLSEQRTGFIHQDTLLRIAEVIVNKRNETNE